MRRETGFTFIETVLAILIIGIGLFGIMNLFQGTVSTSVDTDRTLQATELARERIERILFDKKMNGYDYVTTANYPMIESFSGSFAPFSRTISIREVESDNFNLDRNGSGYKRVAVTVSWEGGRVVMLETLLTKWNE
ncbi:MAG: prepilin-type N-terminal cleavage/methylation domain-containing protein [Deltaproteobacteria bacterium]|nr:prepilin-type N-terminal cleavage/methylation domain-containing protein [Deltaproteobacteria bacterium]